MRLLAVAAALVLLFSESGCRTGSGTPGRRIARGVIFRTVPRGSGVSPAGALYVLDVDLRSAGVRTQVVAEGAHVRGNRIFADARTVRDWCERLGAIGGINGGYFGATDGTNKEVMGLLAVHGEVLSSGRLVHSQGDPRRRFARCVLAFDADGLPHIGWAVAERGRAPVLTAFAQPVNPVAEGYWNSDSVVACGPRLVEGGRIHVTDHEERLMSPAPLWRTFAGYSMEAGRPRYLALCIGEALTYADAAGALQRYFRQYHKAACAEGMCLDGGASSQLVYLEGGRYQEARPGGPSVPDAVLILPASDR